jgi:hypothetical protein
MSLEECLHSVLRGYSHTKADKEYCLRCNALVDTKEYRAGLHYRIGRVEKHYFAKKQEDMFYLRKIQR